MCHTLWIRRLQEMAGKGNCEGLHLIKYNIGEGLAKTMVPVKARPLNPLEGGIVAAGTVGNNAVQ